MVAVEYNNLILVITQFDNVLFVEHNKRNQRITFLLKRFFFVLVKSLFIKRMVFLKNMNFVNQNLMK